MSRWLLVAALVTVGTLVTVSSCRPGDFVLKAKSEARALDGKSLVVSQAMKDRGTMTQNVLAVVIGDVPLTSKESRRLGWILEPDEVDYTLACNVQAGQTLRLRYTPVARPHGSTDVQSYLILTK